MKTGAIGYVGLSSLIDWVGFTGFQVNTVLTTKPIKQIRFKSP